MIDDKRIDEALRFLLLPGERRVELARQAERTQTLIPTLDDEVMYELRKRGFVEHRTVGSLNELPDGASVATDGRGTLKIVEVTFRGRARVGGGC